MRGFCGNSPQKDRVRVLAGINFSGVGPGWADKAIAQLEADVKAGAVGVGEVSKAFGLRTAKPDGSRLHIDDPELDAIWDEAATLNIPVFIHTADPEQFFEPLDYKNERWLEQALFQFHEASCQGHRVVKRRHGIHADTGFREPASSEALLGDGLPMLRASWRSPPPQVR